MPIRIKSKNSVVKDKAPLPADLEIGELALNAHQDSPAIYLKDAAGAVRKVAGDGAVGATQWTRTGTELSPKTAGDSVFTSGAVKVGGTTAAPNITLKADGGGYFAGKVGVGTNSPRANLQVLDSLKVSNASESEGSVVLGDGGSATFNVGIARWNGATNAPGSGGLGYFAQGVSNNGGHYFYTGDAAAGSQVERARLTPTGDFLLGGTLPASPNITLSAAGNIRALGAVSRVYADNTAAKAGGLVDGDIYRTATGQLMIVFT